MIFDCLELSADVVDTITLSLPRPVVLTVLEEEKARESVELA